MFVSNKLLYVDTEKGTIPVGVDDILFINPDNKTLHLTDGTELVETKMRRSTLKTKLQIDIPHMFCLNSICFSVKNVLWKDLASGVPKFFTEDAVYCVCLKPEGKGISKTVYLSGPEMMSLLDKAETQLGIKIPQIEEDLMCYGFKWKINELHKINVSSCDCIGITGSHTWHSHSLPLSWETARQIVSKWKNIKHMDHSVLNLDMISWENTLRMGTEAESDKLWLVDHKKNRLTFFLTKKEVDSVGALDGIAPEELKERSVYCRTNSVYTFFGFRGFEYPDLGLAELPAADAEAAQGRRPMVADAQENCRIDPGQICWEDCLMHNGLTEFYDQPPEDGCCLMFRDGSALRVSPTEYAAQAAAAGIRNGGIALDKMYCPRDKTVYPLKENMLIYNPGDEQTIMLKNRYSGKVRPEFADERKLVPHLTQCGCDLRQLVIISTDKTHWGPLRKLVYINCNAVDMERTNERFESVAVCNEDYRSFTLFHVHPLICIDGTKVPDIWIDAEEWKALCSQEEKER